ncbi:MAG TPA: ATP-binding protein [Gemmatimonadales bacterium]
MRQLGFRARLFAILLLFAALPALVVTVGWSVTVTRLLPLVSSDAMWDRVAGTGDEALRAARSAPLTPEQRAALDAHERELTRSLTLAARYRYLAARALPVLLLAALLGLTLLVLGASRVAGHLSRQLSRPLDEIVGWTERIARGVPLPDDPPRRGAPEFAVLRRRMRRMAAELERARTRALETERLRSFRETARQVAHELRNPLTPIRFAIARLERDAPPSLAEPVEVLAVESERLERMARSFAQFGRLLEGPSSDVDMGELARYTARAVVPEEIPLRLEVADGLPLVHGYHDALARALSNVMLNAVEACRDGGEIRVSVQPATVLERAGVVVAVSDTGSGIPAERIGRVWDPYVTTKSTGTGLGLAIVRQIVTAHDGIATAESTEGMGTTITIGLPASETLAFTGEWHA